MGAHLEGSRVARGCIMTCNDLVGRADDDDDDDASLYHHVEHGKHAMVSHCVVPGIPGVRRDLDHFEFILFRFWSWRFRIFCGGM